jgi:hypothetical protein
MKTKFLLKNEKVSARKTGNHDFSRCETDHELSWNRGKRFKDNSGLTILSLKFLCSPATFSAL